MTSAQRLRYRGATSTDDQARQSDFAHAVHPDSPPFPEPYKVSPELEKAVNLAIFLRRPLLLEGDAGCGKTRLAYDVAYRLGLPLYRWDVRSSTKAQDGLYEYDAILRLHDVEVQKLSGFEETQADETNDTEAIGDDEPPARRDPGNPKHYRQFGPLGKAFRLQDCPAVVLIDEIDKADLDFPNDLLTVLDEPWSFTIRETNETITAAETCKPIIIITSNKEKGNLPAPFLRRCLYRYVEFPRNPDDLQAIVERHYQIRGNTPPPVDLTEQAVATFLQTWNQSIWFKKPGTSEFLDWLKALHEFDSEPYRAEQLKQDQDNVLPYPELLFKRQDDWRNAFKPAS